MDQIKIGSFIAECRKKQGLTQMQLAEKIGITDRAVSKWETGRSLPDSSIMLELCGLLGISVNDLLCGEVVSMDKYNEEFEKSLLKMIKEKEETDRRLLKHEIFIGFAGVFNLILLILLAGLVEMPVWVRVLTIIFAFAVFLGLCFIALRMEQTAGYYECTKCGHRYVPTFSATTMAPHMGRKRRMKCPACQEVSWQNKVISKDK